MKYVAILLLLISLISCVDESNPGIIDSYLFGCGQEEANESLLSVYSGINRECKSLIFSNPFKDKDHWFTGSNNDYNFNIRNSTYELLNKSNSNYYLNCPFSSDNYNSFEVTVKFTALSQQGSFSINVLGFDSFNNTNIFKIDFDGTVRIGQNLESKFQIHHIDKFEPLSNTSHEMMVRVYNGEAYYFFDKNFVFRSNKITDFGNEITLTSGANSEITVNDIEFYSINF